MGVEQSYYDRLPKQYFYDAAKNDYQVHTTIMDEWGNRRVNVVHFGPVPPPGFPASGLVGHYPGYMGNRGPDYTTTRTVQTLRPVHNTYEVPTNGPVYTKTRNPNLATTEKTTRPSPTQSRVTVAPKPPVDTANDAEIARRLQAQFDEETSLYSLSARPPTAAVVKQPPTPVPTPTYASVPIQPLPPVYASHLGQQTPAWMLDTQFQFQANQPLAAHSLVEQPRISPLDPPTYAQTMKQAPPPAYQPITLQQVSPLNPPEYKAPQISPLYSQPLGSLSPNPQIYPPQSESAQLSQIQRDKLDFLQRQEREKAEMGLMERERQRIKENSILQAQAEEEQRHQTEQAKLRHLEQQQILEQQIAQRRERAEAAALEQQKLQAAIEERRKQEEQEAERQKARQAYELEQQRIREMSKQLSEEAQVEQTKMNQNLMSEPPALLQRIPTARNTPPQSPQPVAVVHKENASPARSFNLLGFAEPSVKGFEAHDDL